MEDNDLSLSVEELALAMSLAGHPEMARDLLVAQLGITEAEEVQIRLLTAGHSLLARGWLVMDAQGETHMADNLARVARVLSRADFSIRCSRSHPQADLSFSFHFGEGGVFAHRVEQGVVHHIAEVPENGAVIQGCLTFFEIAETHPFASPSTDISKALLDKVKDEKDISSVLNSLAEGGVPEEARTLLAEDVVGVRYRGSILRVEYDENNLPICDKGLLVLRGPERIWLLRTFVREKEPAVSLLPGTASAFQQEVTSLFCVPG